MNDQSVPTLEERVRMFNMLSLPGQPMSMHKGTSYLVNDLWDEVRKLRDIVASYHLDAAKNERI